MVTPPKYPDVPKAPGVPPVKRNPLSAAAGVPVTLVTDLVTALFDRTPKWGIYDKNNKPVLLADSVVEVEYKQDWQISDYQVEQGGVASYNKVACPFDAKVRLTKAGSSVLGIGSGDPLAAIKSGGTSLLTSRAEFLAGLEKAAASLDLYSIVTPDKVYYNVNITHYDYRRTARHGVTLLVVDVWLQEIRQVVTTKFTNTATPSGADPVNGGTVQTTPATSSQADQWQGLNGAGQATNPTAGGFGGVDGSGKAITS